MGSREEGTRTARRAAGARILAARDRAGARPENRFQPARAVRIPTTAKPPQNTRTTPHRPAFARRAAGRRVYYRRPALNPASHEGAAMPPQ